ncbi:MAG: VWA domain-containing protein [Peptococcaceae bacterium]|nr:VWA domain-containing protein [Peptococcaceae bacterium]
MGCEGGVRAAVIIACALAGGYFVCQGLRLRGAYPRKKFLAWALLKAATLSCLVLAAWGLRVTLPAAGTTTIFLVDRSLSMEEKAGEIEGFINRQLRGNKGGRDRVAVVSFAREPMVERPVSRDLREIRLEAAPDPNFTDIQKALEFCREYFPREDNKRLVLITDGRENLGNADQALRSLADRGINLAVLPVITPSSGDVRLLSLKAPAGARRGNGITLGAELYSDYDTRGTFRLYNGTVKVLEQPVTVKAGNNTFSFGVAAAGEAGTVFRGEISFAGDRNPRNDFFTVTVPLQDSPAVLVIGEREDTANIARLLASLGYAAVIRRPGEVPGEPGMLSAYGGIVLANVRYRDLPQGFEAALRNAVEEQGAGLLAVGGDSAFGPGGYENTLLEQMLPVRCRMKGNEKVPDTGLVLAVDCSGSMNDRSGGARKIEIVKEAAVKSMEALDENDRLGVLAFSDRQEWAVPFGPPDRKDDVRERIGKLAPGGGTLILPALEKAVETLEKAEVKVKHIILLTDGQGEKEGYDGVVQRIRAGGITLSAVAVGQDADRQLIRALAEKGGGRGYYTEHYRDIPEIFTRETYLATRKYLNSREFVPRPAGGGGPYGGEALPKLYGYTGTGIKDGAELLLESDSGDPVLARWQYGLGRVAAWTPDLSGRWSREWIRWSGLQSFFGRVLDDLLAVSDGEGLDINVSQRGCRVRVSVSASGYQRGQSLELLLFPPSGEGKRVALEQAGSGVFEGVFDLDQTGSHALYFRLAGDGEIIRQARRTVHLDYSPEFAGGRDQDVFLPAAFGQVVDWDANVFDLPLERKNAAAAPLGHVLLALALAAFAAELWVRKMM